MCNDYESRLASQVLRDREFDSVVRADYTHANQQSVQAPANPERIEAGTESDSVVSTKQAESFSAIDKVWDNIRSAIASGDVQGAQETAQQAVDETLQQYYKGFGVFDHVRFLTDLETSKGAPLDQEELRFFGRVVGNWVVASALAEIYVIPDRNDHSEARLKEVTGG